MREQSSASGVAQAPLVRATTSCSGARRERGQIARHPDKKLEQRAQSQPDCARAGARN